NERQFFLTGLLGAAVRLGDVALADTALRELDRGRGPHRDEHVIDVEARVSRSLHLLQRGDAAGAVALLEELPDGVAQGYWAAASSLALAAVGRGDEAVAV